MWPRPIQFKTRALEAQAWAQLACQQRASREMRRTPDAPAGLRRWLRRRRPGKPRTAAA